jgi:Plasma-membrane choline transporter
MDMNKAIEPPHAVGVRITPGTAEALLGDESLSLPKFDDSHFKDVTFSILFVLNVVIVFALAFSSGISIFEFGHLEVKNTDGSRNDEDYSREPGKIIGGLIVILFSGGILSLGWIVVLSKFATKIIPVTFGVILMATGLAGVLMLLSRMTILGICLLVGACISLLFFKLLKPHIELASCNLKIACEAIRAMPCTILAAGVVMMAQILFFFAWMIATIDVSTNQDALNISSRDGTKFKLSQCTTYLLQDNEVSS